MKPQDRARQLRPLIEKAVESLDNKDASLCAELFPAMKYDGSLITQYTRINWNGRVKIAAVDLWDVAENSPDNAPNLWDDIDYRDGIRIIPEIITAVLAFSLGEKGWWGDDLYESLIDSNVYTPVQYPNGWKLIS